MSHTPGPWNKCNCSIYAELDGETVANCTQKEMHRAFFDARLIAAAPEMLDALQAALRDYEAFEIFGPGRNAVLEVIKKARGE